MSFRKEKKYRLSISDMAQFQNGLLKLGMKELYPCRIIKSCYFDNDHLTFFQDSEEGVLPRKKVRIRWYNDSLKFTKETKISSIEGRYKFAKVKEELTSVNDVFKSNYFDQSYGRLTPSVMVSYERQYFILNSLRITFDRNIYYRYLKSNFFKVFRDKECVMEVKASIECEDDFIYNLIPHPTARFSKYSRGMLFFKKML